MPTIATAIMSSMMVKPPRRRPSRDVLGIARSFKRANDTFAVRWSGVNYIMARSDGAMNGRARPTSGSDRRGIRRFNGEHRSSPPAFRARVRVPVLRRFRVLQRRTDLLESRWIFDGREIARI